MLSESSWALLHFFSPSGLQTPCLSPLDFWDIECHSNFFQLQNIKFKKVKNQFDLISKLIFAGYTGSRNQVQNRKKIKLVLNSIFFQVWNKLRNPKFENRVQRDRALDKLCLLHFR
jgi:hypothetical protein